LQLYNQATLIENSHTQTKDKSCEWVPWNVINTMYGETEAARRLVKGTIEYKPDTTDPAEFVFRIVRVIDRQ
jgi:hypothetical protein